uniref:Uncharacterized protein n=1 Tax=Melopsittacus undulatus TaxID=13146 RepID=A0A8C6IS92_MELUD
MNELSKNYKQMQKDVEFYQSQIEAGKASYKKMQADFQKELQSVFQENTRLTLLMEGKVPKDLCSLQEVEKKAADLKGELEEALKENVLLQKQVNELSEFRYLPNTVEIQQKEILEKCEEVRVLKLEREKLLSEVADNEIRLKHMTEEIGKSKDDLAAAQLKYVKSDQEYVALKQLHEELEQKYAAASENNKHMELQIDTLSKEAQESKVTLDEVKLELSRKMKELEEKTVEHKQLLEVKEDFIQTQQKLNKMEQLKEQEKIMELKLKARDSEIQAVLQQLAACQEEIKVLTQERDDLKQKKESLQAEAYQLKEDIKDTVSMNILAHEELRNTQSVLKESQDTVKNLEKTVSEKQAQILSVEEALGKTIKELEIQSTLAHEELKNTQSVLKESQDTVKKLEKTVSEKQAQILSVEEALGKTIKELEIQISQMTEEIKIITSERDQLAKEKFVNNHRESDELQVQKEQTLTENNSLQDKLDSLHQKQEGEVTLIPQIEEKPIEQELFLLREELRQAQKKLHEMEEAKADECPRESEQMGRTDLNPKVHECQELSILSERDNLKMQLENLQNESDQLRETILQMTSRNSEMKEELRCAQNSLAELKESLSEKENQLLKAQEVLKETTDELQQKLTEVTGHLSSVSSEYDKLQAEKEQIERTMNEHFSQQLEKINQEKDELQKIAEACKAERDQLEADCWKSKERILETEKELKWQQELLSNEKTKAEEREEYLSKIQRRSEIVEDCLTSKLQQLTEVLNNVSCEKDQLLAEKSSHSSQLKEEISVINQEKEELQKHLQDVRSERDQLKEELQKNSEKCAETNAKLECALDQLKQRNLNDMSVQVDLDNAEQMAEDRLKEMNFKIVELLEKFPAMAQRYECLSTVSLNLKNALNSQKAVIAAIETQLSSEQSKQVKILQTINEKINRNLQSLLNKVKFLFSRVCSKKRDYYATVNKYEMELLEEKRKQDQLQAQIQYLRKTYFKQNEVSSQELNISEVLQSLHLEAESIFKDVSEMESELLCIEAELQQEESDRKETAQFWEACSGAHCDAEELEKELRKDNERLSQVINFWNPKVKILLQLSSELDARTASYCRNADLESKQRKEKSGELLQELNTLKEQLAPGGSASQALEEENCRLHNKLRTAQQDVKAMEVKIQELENVIKEVGKNLEEKDDTINKLQAQIRIKMETSELTQLQDKLNEMEKCLKTALTENQSLQAKLDKGAELYKEEIDNLKTQLVKCDMERMKQSKSFDTKLANYKALAEHQEQQVTKLKEELRRAHQQHDATVVPENEAPQQSQTPITCGGGSGIVQSTQILILKSERVRLQKENSHLTKQLDILQSNELQLKEEVRKWKERALKKEKLSRENAREMIPSSPKKTVSSSLKEQMPSPAKEPISQEAMTADAGKTLLPTSATNFFDNSSLGILTGTQPVGKELPEEHLKHWFGTSEKDKAPDCIAQ